MKSNDKYLMRGKILITVSIIIFLISVGLIVAPTMETENGLILDYEYVNIKDMATTSVAQKLDDSTIIKKIFKPIEEKGLIVETALPLKENTIATLSVPKQIWYLPTEIGTISQYPRYGHVALDITSPRGVYENIFPVANGVVSGMYHDSAGAKIITVAHKINGIDYTSQYVHLSSYAPDMYVGREVTINDVLGKMGTTGRSTGVHLHLAVLDCRLFDSNDPKCPDLNSFFRYGKQRYSEGYYGLGTMMNVPWNWYSR